jgi:hypothetical protein
MNHQVPNLVQRGDYSHLQWMTWHPGKSEVQSQAKGGHSDGYGDRHVSILPICIWGLRVGTFFLSHVLRCRTREGTKYPLRGYGLLRGQVNTHRPWVSIRQMLRALVRVTVLLHTSCHYIWFLLQLYWISSDVAFFRQANTIVDTFHHLTRMSEMRVDMYRITH